MKRSRFDAEYERVRNQSGARRPVQEFDPDYDVHERNAAARVEALRQDFHDRMNALAKADAEKAAEAAVRHGKRRLEIDRRIMLDEYAALGLDPPEPLCSLGLLLSIGWRIDNFGGKNVLTRMDAERPRRRVEQPSAPNDDIPF